MRFERFIKWIIVTAILLTGVVGLASAQDTKTNTSETGQSLTLVWESELFGDATLIAPVDLVIDAWGNVYVSTAAAQPIKKFDANGNFVTHWGENHGEDEGQFSVSSGISVDTAGNVYVGDFNNRRIQKFDSTGNFLLEWQTDSPAGPASITVDAEGYAYVDNFTPRNNYIQKFDEWGNMVLSWGTYGTGEGELGVRLEDITLDAEGNIYVADRMNHRIQKFDSEGNFLSLIGGEASKEGNGQFYEPGGVAVDPDGNVYVIDGYFLQKFDAEGNFLAQWSTTEGGDFDRARTIVAVDSWGDVYLFAYTTAVNDKGKSVTPLVVKKFHPS